MILEKKCAILGSMNKILKSEKELDQLKDMLEQDATSSGKKAYFSSEDPLSYPCLAIYEEIEQSSMDVEIDEDVEFNGIEDLEGLDFEIEESYCYDFIFISKQEIEELLAIK